jgi:hypothetical protein
MQYGKIRKTKNMLGNVIWGNEIRGNVKRGNIFSGRCIFGEMWSVRKCETGRCVFENMVCEKMWYWGTRYGEMWSGEIYFRENVTWENVNRWIEFSRKCSEGKCDTGKWFAGSAGLCKYRGVVRFSFTGPYEKSFSTSYFWIFEETKFEEELSSRRIDS